MKLDHIILKNFRIFREETRINFDDLTVFLGRNDIGKSTILEALEIFFNNKQVKIEKLDASIKGDNTDVRIGCVFKSLPELLSIDVLAETTLENEWLLNDENMLEIIKIYNCSLVTPKEKVYASAVHPTAEGFSTLHLFKNNQLKSFYEELGLAEEIDKRSNVQLRRAIWNSADDLKEQLKLVSLEEEDGKKIWSKIKNELPLYALFQSDRTSTDDDSEVQDPMKIAIKEAIAEITSELENIKSHIQDHVKEVAQRTLEKLKEIDPELASELVPRFKSEPKWETLFKLSFTDENQIPINKRGSGTRRLILISFFRAEAERKRIENSKNDIIYAIEEPETSQHPSNQKIILEALEELSEIEGCQVVITTHVPGLAGLVPISSVRLLKHYDGVLTVVDAKSENVLEEVTDELGIFPDVRIQLLICVEGPTDVLFFENISKILNSSNPSIPILSTDHRVAIFPMGGSNLNQWVDNHYTRNLGLPEIHVYDRDIAVPPKYQNAVDTVNARHDNSWATLTDKREIENYIHPDAVYDIFNVRITFGDMDDVPQILITVINSDPSNPYYQLSESRAKKILNSVCVEKMNSSRISAIDTNNEIINWFNEITSRLS